MWITCFGSENKWTDKSQVALIPSAHVISRQNRVPDQNVCGIGWHRKKPSHAPDLGTATPDRIQGPAPKVLEDHGPRDCTARSWDKYLCHSLMNRSGGSAEAIERSPRSSQLVALQRPPSGEALLRTFVREAPVGRTAPRLSLRAE